MTPIELINCHIDRSIERALRGESFLNPDVLKISGFATATMRHLFSNLCRGSGESLSYLEIGTFCGATFVSAFNNNPIHAVGIDNFTQPFHQTNVREQLADNLRRWSHTAKSVQFFDCDAFALTGNEVFPSPVDIYYYDGEHSYESQVKALPTFLPMMADRFIYIVDDFHWDDVVRGTRDALKQLSSQGHTKIESEWTLDGERSHEDPIWWNGVAIFLISKLKG